MKDFYKILYIQPSATEEEIKVAYRKLAHQHHPDKGGSEDKFKEINEAYQILSDKYQRGAYDATIFIMRQSAAYSTTAPKSTAKDSNAVRNAVILFLIGIGLWVWGDGSDSYNGFLVFLGWAFVIGAIVVYRKGKVTETTEEEIKIVEEEILKSQTHTDTHAQPFQKGTDDSTQEGAKTSPPDNIGFGRFFAKYGWEMSFSEQNKYILSIFPGDFWKSIGVSFDDVSKHADILCQSEDILTETIKKSDNAWIIKHGAHVYRAMKEATIWNEGLMKDKNFQKKCAEIALAELQVLGIKMLALLPKNEQEMFLEQCHRYYPPSINPDFVFSALRIWADVVCVPYAENDGIVPPKKEAFPRIHLSEVVQELGFISTIAWLREFPTTHHNFDKLTQRFSKFLLDVKKLKSYSMFDSAFFPYSFLVLSKDD